MINRGASQEHPGKAWVLESPSPTNPDDRAAADLHDPHPAQASFPGDARSTNPEQPFGQPDYRFSAHPTFGEPVKLQEAPLSGAIRPGGLLATNPEQPYQPYGTATGTWPPRNFASTKPEQEYQPYGNPDYRPPDHPGFGAPVQLQSPQDRQGPAGFPTSSPSGLPASPGMFPPFEQHPRGRVQGQAYEAMDPRFAGMWAPGADPGNPASVPLAGASEKVPLAGASEQVPLAGASGSVALAGTSESVPLAGEAKQYSAPMNPSMGGAAEGLLLTPSTGFKKNRTWTFFDDAWQGLGGSLPTEYVHVHLFTLAFAAMYCAPLAICVSLAKDPTVQYWVGNWALLGFFVPVCLLVSYVGHARVGHLSFLSMVIGSVFPAIVLIFIGQIHLSQTKDVLQELQATNDCVTYKSKVDVQRAWKVADRLLDQCIVSQQEKYKEKQELFGGDADNRKMGKAFKLPKNDPMKVTIQDCQKYIAVGQCSTWFSRDYTCSSSSSEQEYWDQWSYLKRLEAEQRCSGWCSFGRPLWTLDSTQDSCSAVSAGVIERQVRPFAWMLEVVSFLILVLAILCIFGAQKAGHIRKIQELFLI